MKLILSILLFITCLTGKVTITNNVVGGLMTYQQIAHTSCFPTCLDSIYRLRARLLLDTSVSMDYPTTVHFSVWDNDTGLKIWDTDQGLDDYYYLPSNPVPCSDVPAKAILVVGYYLTINLHQNNTGFYASFQGCCRSSGFTNIAPGQGYTYWILIPPISQPDNNPDFNL